MAINTAQIRKECVYRGNAPLPDILNDLEEFEKLAQGEQAFRKKIRWASLVCLILGVVLAFLSPAMLVLGILLALGLFIYSFIYGRGVLGHANREQFLRDLVTTLQPDSSSKAPYTVTLGLKSKEQKLSEEPFPHRKNGKQQFLSDEWLTIEGRFLDGTEFSETVTDLIRRRTYRNVSNKTKTKSRTYSLVSLKLRYPAEIYGDARVVYKSLSNSIKVPPTAKLKGVQVSEKAVALKAVVREQKDLKQANAMLFLGAYRILNLSRQVAAKGGAR